MKSTLEGKINLGKTLISELNQIGIFSLEDLTKTGSVLAYLKICLNKQVNKLPFCYYLYSFEGAIKNIHWTKFSKSEKKRLVDLVYQSYERKISVKNFSCS